MPIVHIICATLKPDAPEDAIAHAIDLGRLLRDASGVQHAVLGHTDDHLIAVTWLEGRDALEPFAAAPVHMAFIMRGLAPCVSGMWSAAVESDTPPPPVIDTMWVFALRSVDSLFEWQVRDLLTSIDALPGTAAVGPTFEERDRYRAGGAVCLAAGEVIEFNAALGDAHAAWGPLGASIVESKVEVIPLRPGGDIGARAAHDR